MASKAACQASRRESPLAKARPNSPSWRFWGNRASSGSRFTARVAMALLIRKASVFPDFRASSMSGVLLKEENAPTSGTLLLTSSSKGAPVSMETVLPLRSENSVYSG